MKYLLVIAFVLVAYWFWRQNRDSEDNGAAPAAPRSRPPSQPALQATEVVACQLCDLHLPRNEALIGPQGIFCSDAHRRQAEHR